MFILKRDKYNKFVKPLAYTMLFFAATHIVVATFLTVIRVDLHYLNIFYISGLAELVPEIDKGTGSFLVSTVIVLVIYLLFYAKQKH